jgi:hypothetical protein
MRINVVAYATQRGGWQSPALTLFMKLSFWDVTCSSFNPDDFRKFRDKRRAAGSMFFSHSLLRVASSRSPRCRRRQHLNGGCLCVVQLRTRAKAKSCAVFSLFVHAFHRLYSPVGLG